MKHCITIWFSFFAIFFCVPAQAHFGNHHLIATATHPWNGATNYSVKSTNTFTAQANSTVDVGFDGMGNVTSRSLTGGKTQTLTWDGLGRLVKVAQRDSGNSGYDWTAWYDGLGRRLLTIQTNVVGGVYSTNVETIESYYDPEVEFQEVGVSYNGRLEWKLYGPDLNGVYGGLMGIGGLEMTVRESDGRTTAVLNNYFGDVVATVSGGAVKWGTTQFASSGPVLGYEPPRLSYNIPLAEALGRWGKRQDVTGFTYNGARYLHEGRFLSADPMGFGGSTWDLYGYANGDMLNGYDADGRFAKQVYNNYVQPNLQSGYDSLVDRNGTPGPYNNFTRYVLGGAPSWLGVDPAPQNIYYNGDDRFTQALIASPQFQNGNEALPKVRDYINNGATFGQFNASLQNSPLYQPVIDVAGFATHGVIGGEYQVSYTGSWGGNWNVAGQNENTTTINFSGMNPTTAASNTRTPFPRDWRYGHPSLQENISNGNIMQNPVNIQWNGWMQLPAVRFQSPIVPFSSLLSENPFGVNGPLRSVYQHYNFQQTVPTPASTQSQTRP